MTLPNEVGCGRQPRPCTNQTHADGRAQTSQTDGQADSDVSSHFC